MRPLITVSAVFALMLGLAMTPDAAHAATPNWLDRDCGSHHVTTSCVEEPLTVDSLSADRALIFHDASGARHRVNTAAWVWKVAHDHSVPCKRHGDPHGCFVTEPGIGKAVVLHSGMAIALKFFH